MISIPIMISLLLIHWVADFIFQTDKQAKGKSTSIKYLLSHTFIYSISWFCPLAFYGIVFGKSMEILLFIPITFLFHTITDYFTSRLNKNSMRKETYTISSQV